MLTPASGRPDLKPEARIRDPRLLARLHLIWKACALCKAIAPLSLHHISKHPRHDLEENLVMLCGSGTTGCHGKIEAHDEETMTALGQYILRSRPDVVTYLYEQHGAVAAQEWMRRHFLIPES